MEPIKGNFDKLPAGKLSVLSGALLSKTGQLSFRSMLRWPSIARAKTAVFHTFHENKVKIISTIGLVSDELKVMK
jgi:hypothetical protein